MRQIRKLLEEERKKHESQTKPHRPLRRTQNAWFLRCAPQLFVTKTVSLRWLRMTEGTGGRSQETAKLQMQKATASGVSTQPVNIILNLTLRAIRVDTASGFTGEGGKGPAPAKALGQKTVTASDWPVFGSWT